MRGRMESLIRRFEGDFDVVILDCPPGLSFAALAALKTADKVIVPFRPDYVSQLAVDRVALLIEDKRSRRSDRDPDRTTGAIRAWPTTCATTTRTI